MKSIAHPYKNLATSLSRLSAANLAILVLSSNLPMAGAATLEASDDARSDYFGSTSSRSGRAALVGAYNSNSSLGSAYLYRGVSQGTEPLTEDLRLVAAESITSQAFGISVSLEGNTALVGDDFALINGLYQGAAYVFHQLDTASGTVTENVRLLASDAQSQSYFGFPVCLSGPLGLVSADYHTVGNYQYSGEAYLFRNLDTATGTIFESARLVPSNPQQNAYFGESISLEGSTALVGATSAGAKPNFGTVYLFRHLDTATGTVHEDARLKAYGTYYFGEAASLSGNLAVIGAYETAYLFRDLDTAAGLVTSNIQLAPLDDTSVASFGLRISLSGTDALVSAADSAVKSLKDCGIVYLYCHLGTGRGMITENLYLYPSDGTGYHFGSSVSLDGDGFVIGADGANQSTGRAFSGNVSTLITFDAGDVSRSLEGLSFVSHDSWTIGRDTDANQFTLFFGDSAEVRGAGKAIYIGLHAGSDANTLVLRGLLVANLIYVGSPDGNMDNTLRLEDLVTLSVRAIRVSPGNQVLIHGNYLKPGALASYFGVNKLQVWQDGTWQTVTAAEASQQITVTYTQGYTAVQPKSHEK